jgi:hypothetical protein
MKFDILRQGSAARNALDAIQDKIKETLQTVKVTELGLLPHEETRARLQRAIEAELSRFSPENRYSSFQQPLNPEALLSNNDVSARGYFAEILWLMGPDAVLDRIMKFLSSSKQPAGMPAAKRADKLRDLRVELDRLEREEELQILALEKEGHVILRRDVRPELLLQVWLKFPGGVAPAAEVSTKPVSAASAATSRTRA